MFICILSKVRRFQCTSLPSPIGTGNMAGYLQKKAKTGKWQKRWFETNAHYLTYYKVCRRCTSLRLVVVRPVCYWCLKCVVTGVDFSRQFVFRR